MYRKFGLLMCAIIFSCLFLPACNSFGRAETGANPPLSGTVISIPTPIKTQGTPSFSTSSLNTRPSPTQVENAPRLPGETAVPISDVGELSSSAEIAKSALIICSPLSLHPLSELREITSDAYRPPPPGKEERHHGIDFSYYRHGDRLTIQGVGVQSVLPGKVAASLVESYPYGNVVIVETPYSALPEEVTDLLPIGVEQSIYTLYAHLDQPPLVSSDENVASCQALGQVGKSGNAVEPHLHLEMRIGPAAVVFHHMGYYKAANTEEERSNYVRWRTGGEFNHFDPMLVLRDAARLLGEIE